MKRWIAKLLVMAGMLMVGPVMAQVNDVEDLPWVVGPASGEIGRWATIKVPDGYVFLGPEGAREFNRLTENPSPDNDEYVLASDDLSWVAFFSYAQTGYIKDEEKLDADELLTSARDGTEAANEQRKRNGWEAVHVTGWAFQPQYDTALKSLEWAFRLRGEGQEGESINYNTRLLGRHGVMEVLLVTSSDQLQTSVADFKQQLPGFSFNSGERYADFRAGDPVAEYGLAALVTGGAAVVAAKKGWFAALAVFLAKMWKLLVVGVIALLAVLRKVFSRKSAQG